MGAVCTQLSITERRKTERWRHAKVPVDEMARVLKRCRRQFSGNSDHELKMICDRLNATPRKCLGWKAPAEVFRERMMDETGQHPNPQKE